MSPVEQRTPLAVNSTTSGFGKRAIHRVWSDELRGGEFVWLSQGRGWVAVALFTGLATACLRAAILGFADPAPVPAFAGAPVLIAALFGGIGAALLWAALHVLRSLLKPGPVLRLDPSRIVFRAASGHIVLAWEDLTLSFGRLFLRIRVRSSRGQSADRTIPDEILVPFLLLSGGASGVRNAVGRVRPELLRGVR